MEGAFAEVYKGTVIGYKRIVPLERLVTKCIRIRILDSRTEPTLAFVGVYKSIK
jgi:alpha-L-fucosidase